MDNRAYSQSMVAFAIKSDQFLDNRIPVATKNGFTTLTETDYPAHGFRAYCVETDTWWKFDIDNESIAEVNGYQAGKWRLDEPVIFTEMALTDDGLVPDEFDSENARKDRFYSFTESHSQYKLKKEGTDYFGVEEWQDLIFNLFPKTSGDSDFYAKLTTEAAAAGMLIEDGTGVGGATKKYRGLNLKGINGVTENVFYTNLGSVYLSGSGRVTFSKDGLVVDGGTATEWDSLTEKAVNRLVSSGDLLKYTPGDYKYNFQPANAASKPFVNMFGFVSGGTKTGKFVYVDSTDPDFSLETTASFVDFKDIDAAYIKKLFDFGIIEATEVATDPLQSVMFTGSLGQRLICKENNSTATVDSIWQLVGHDIYGKANWRKMFPLDASLDPNSLNGITNKAVAFELSKVAHSLTKEVDEFDETITILKLRDGKGNVLSTVRISASGAIIVGPDAVLTLNDDEKVLKELGVAVASGDLVFKLVVTKTDKDVKPDSVKLYKVVEGGTDEEITGAFATGISADGGTSTYNAYTVSTADAKGDQKFYAVVKDEEDNETKTKNMVLKFVVPAYYGCEVLADADFSSADKVLIDDIETIHGYTCGSDKPFFMYNEELGAVGSIGGCENPKGKNTTDVAMHNFAVSYEGFVRFVDLPVTYVPTLADITVESPVGYYCTEDTKKLYKVETVGTVPTTEVSVTEGDPNADDTIAKDSTSVVGTVYAELDSADVKNSKWWISKAGRYLTTDTDDQPCFIIYTFKLPVGITDYYLVFNK